MYVRVQNRVDCIVICLSLWHMVNEDILLSYKWHSSSSFELLFYAQNSVGPGERYPTVIRLHPTLSAPLIMVQLLVNVHGLQVPKLLKSCSCLVELRSNEL